MGAMGKQRCLEVLCYYNVLHVGRFVLYDTNAGSGSPISFFSLSSYVVCGW